MATFRKIGILTSGGDAPGMNASVKAVVNRALSMGIEVVGVVGGYAGLIQGDLIPLTNQNVGGVLSHGGTFLYSSRCPEFKTEEGMAQAIATCKKNEIDALVCIGGDGTFRGATDMTKRGIPSIGIPGTIGGGIRMNCGAYGTDIASKIRYVDAIHLKTGQHKRFLKKECLFAYRQSIFQSQPYVIIGAAFSLHKPTNQAIFNKMQVILKGRKSKQPYMQYSAGSIFKRPQNGFAAEMIENVGLKGLQIGDAFVSTLHAGFIVNHGNAKSTDVIELIKIIKRKVFEKYSINLNCEIEIWGENDVLHE